jgi:hypothetical protein
LAQSLGFIKLSSNEPAAASLENTLTEPRNNRQDGTGNFATQCCESCHCRNTDKECDQTVFNGCGALLVSDEMSEKGFCSGHDATIYSARSYSLKMNGKQVVKLRGRISQIFCLARRPDQ